MHLTGKVIACLPEIQPLLLVAMLVRVSNSFSFLRAGLVLAIVTSTLLRAPDISANPQNPEVRSGVAEFNFDNPGELIIDQLSDRAIINWESFSIEAGELTRFVQPGSGSAALNRVFSGAPSAIHGALQANGQIFLINPNGILVGPTGVIDTAGFLGSTLDVSDAEFLSGGDMIFRGDSDAAVVNLGTINAIDGGDIFLIAKQVTNEGTLNAKEGTVGLAAGSEVRVAAEGDERISISPGGEGTVTNKGQIAAMTAELKAAGGNEYALAVNNEGVVRATKFESRGGKLYLSAGSGRVVNSGELRASDSVTVTNLEGKVENTGAIRAKDEETGNGGEISIAAADVTLAEGSSVDASGNEAGSVFVLATETAIVDGSIQANGSMGNGGLVQVTGGDIRVGATAEVSANGAANGGNIFFFGGSDGEVWLGGNIHATGGSGNGGYIQATGGNVTVADTGYLDASGGADGGWISLEAEDQMNFNGTALARGGGGDGGRVDVLGENVTLGSTALLDASGAIDGGYLYIGGGRGGRDASLRNARSTTVAPGARLIANGGEKGGDVIIWADGATDFRGSIENTGSTDETVDGGGFAEVSGREELYFAGTVDTGGGQLLLDPFDYTIDATQATAIAGALAGGSVTIDTTADDGTFGSSGSSSDVGHITINADIFYDSLNDLTFLALGDVNFNASVQNRNDTGGDLNVVAGWDGTTAYSTDVFLDEDVLSTTVYGQNEGSVFIGDGTQSAGIAVGSRSGETNVFGYDVNLQGGNGAGDGRFAQLGFQVTNGVALGGFDLDLTRTDGEDVVVDGDMNLHFVHNLSATGGDTGGYTYAQVGHVGADMVGGSEVEAMATSNIEITAGNDVFFSGGDGNSSYAQLGQGGYRAYGNHGGTTTINQADDIGFYGGDGILSYAQLGQGGYRAYGNQSGATNLFDVDDIDFFGGGGMGAYAQLGQGGNSANGNHSGTTTVIDADDITFAGGTGIDAYAQFGQGGIGVDGDHSGTLTITDADEMVFRGGDGGGAYVQLGQGSTGGIGNNSGTTTVTRVYDVTFEGGSGDETYAHLGQGGYSGLGNHSGTTLLSQVGGVTFEGGTGSTSYAQLGQGGGSNNGNHGGTTILSQVGEVTFTAGEGLGAYAQLGQGGAGAEGNHSGDTTLSQVSNVTIEANYVAYAQLGNGGNWANGNHSGTIDLYIQGDLTLTGRSTAAEYARIGHGDELGDSDAGNTVMGDVTVRVLGDAGVENATIGHQIDPDGSYTGGNTYLGVAGTLTADANSQFRSALAAQGGELRIYLTDPANDLVDTAATLNGVAHGGSQAPNSQGSHLFGQGPYTAEFSYYTLPAAVNYIIDATAAANITTALGTGNLVLDTTPFGLAEFGAVADTDGGTSFIRVDNDLFYDSPFYLDLIATGDITFNASLQNRNDTSGDLDIVAGWDGGTAYNPDIFLWEDVDDVTMYGQNDGSVFIGDGTQAAGVAVGTRSGAANVMGYDISLQGGNGAGDGRFAQLGFQVTDGVALGGFDLDPTRTDGENVVVDGDMNLRVLDGLTAMGGDTGARTYAQVGHVGADQVNDTDVEAVATSWIEIAAGGDIYFAAGAGNNAYAQLGQGGANARGNHGGGVTVFEAGDVEFLGGDGARSYAQLGHGGYRTYGNHSGTTEIYDVGDMDFIGGGGANAYAQLGQGGYSARGNHSGTTMVVDAYDLTFEGGTGDYSYAQFGQGGYAASGDHSGTLTIIDAEDIDFLGGDGDYAYAQLGQGGDESDGNHSGTTTVAEVDDVTFKGGAGEGSHAQLGQGGSLLSGNFSGTTLLSQAGDVIFEGGSGDQAYAQLGQGGVHANGNHSGTTTLSQSGEVTFRAGSGVVAYAQLGQGGSSVEGDQSGDTTLSQVSGVTIETSTGASAQLGNGGNQSRGDHSGTIDLYIQGDLTLTRLAIPSSYVRIGHGNDTGAGDTGNTMTGDVIVRVLGDANLERATIGHENGSGGAYASGNTYLGVAGTLTADADSQFRSALDAQGGELRIYLTDTANDLVDTAATLNGVAHGGSQAPNSQGSHLFGSGPYAAEFSYYTLPSAVNYIIDATAAANIATALGSGSLVLDTTPFGLAEFGAVPDLDGGTSFIRVDSDLFYDSPFYLDLIATGDITFNASLQNRNATNGDLELVAGWDGSSAYNPVTYWDEDVSSATMYGQNDGSVFIGDGTQAAGVAVGTRSGITNVFGYDVSLQGGNGAGDGRFAQLGFQVSDGMALGGFDLDPTRNDGSYVWVDGDMYVGVLNVLSATGGDTGEFTYAQVGHVGADLAVDPYIEASAYSWIEIAAGDDILFSGGAGDNAYAQLGHGGSFTRGGHDGGVIIYEADDVEFSGGGGQAAYAQLGQGGASTTGDQWGETVIWDVDDIHFTAGDGKGAYVQLGQGGLDADGDHWGWVEIEDAEDVTFYGGGGTQAYAQLGQGGLDAEGDHSGEVWIEDLDTLDFEGGVGNDAYAQLGQGGYHALGYLEGTVELSDIDEVYFYGGDGDRAYAHLGQGGFGASGDFEGTATLSDIGLLDFNGGEGDDAYVQLGQGGSSAAVIMGNFRGTATLSDIDEVYFYGGVGESSYAQLGQGGFAAGGDHTGTATLSNIGLLDFVAGEGDYAYVQLGQGGDIADGEHSGTTTLSYIDEVYFEGGDGVEAYAQLGQGGAGNDGAHSGTTTLSYINGVYFEGGLGLGSYAQLGQGGLSAFGNHEGTATLSYIGILNFFGGEGKGAYAQLGQGGFAADGDHTGTATLSYLDEVYFYGGVGDYAYAQLGNGGNEASGNHNGMATLSHIGILDYYGGEGDYAYAQLGQGGSTADGSHGGTATLSDIGEVYFYGGEGEFAYAQLGQGGLIAGGNHDGTATLSHIGLLDFLGGDGYLAYVQLGQGGFGAHGDTNGTATLSDIDEVSFQGGEGSTAFAQLGQGGAGSVGDHSGTTVLSQIGSLTFKAGLGTSAYVQLGQGGGGAIGDHSGNLTVSTTGDVTFEADADGAAYALLGHGGVDADGSNSGTIDVYVGGNLTLTGQNHSVRYAQIGHGDDPGDGDAGDTVSGDVTVRADGNITLTKAFLGHQIDGDGTYSSGNTYVGLTGDLTADADSQFRSALAAQGGELRFYLDDPANDLVDAATLLNGIAHGATPAPNNQGQHVFGAGPYTAEFSYYTLPELVNYIVDSTAAANIEAALGTGGVSLITNRLGRADFGAVADLDGGTSFIRVDNDLFYDSLFDLDMIATGDITFLASVQNRNDTGGGLNLVAGWDASTAFDADTFLDEDISTTTLFGQNMGSVFIGDGTQAAGVAVGTRSGTANVFGYDVSLQAGNGAGDNRFAQLGFQVTDGVAQGGFDLDPTRTDGRDVVVDGDMNLRVRNDLSATGGDTGANTYAQVGHVGGALTGFRQTEARATSDIEIAVGNDITFTGGGAIRSYVQLGQGGANAYGNHGGNISITQANDVTFEAGTGQETYAQLGQGGYTAQGSHSGDILVTQVHNLTFTAGMTSKNAYAHLGNGGAYAVGSHEGTIELSWVNDIVFTGGSMNVNYAHLGQGGHDADGSHDGTIQLSHIHDITFSAGSAPGAYAQLGQGGSSADGDHGGTTLMNFVNDVTFNGGTGPEAVAQLGQGGYFAKGNFSGTIDLTIDGDLTLTGGTALNNRYAILGHGDQPGDTDTGESVQGNVTVRVGGDVTLTRAILGHRTPTGGSYTSGNTYLGLLGDLTADADSQLNSALDAQGGELRIYLGDAANDLVDTATKLNGVAHGGAQAPNFQGQFVFGDGPYTPEFSYYVLPDQVNYIIDPEASANIEAALGMGNLSLITNRLGRAEFGAVADTDGGTSFIRLSSYLLYDSPYSLDLIATGNVTFLGGLQNRNTTGGDLNIVAGWDGGTMFDAATFLDEDVSSTTLYGQNLGSVIVGAGLQPLGVAVGTRSGTANVFGNNVTVQGGNGSGAPGRFAQLGFRARDGYAMGDYDLTADGGSLTVDGDMNLRVRNNLKVAGGNDGPLNYAQIGHVGGQAGFDSFDDAWATSNIGIIAGNKVTVTGGDGDLAYAQIGQGGFLATGDFGGTTTISQANSVTFTGGEGILSYAQLGQGGAGAFGDHGGTTEISDTGDVTFAGGEGFGAYAQLGQGGVLSMGDHSGDIRVVDVEDVSLTAGTGLFTQVQVGNGGPLTGGDFSGMIEVSLNGDLTLEGQGLATRYVLLGHGDLLLDDDAGQTVEGDVMVKAGGSATLTNAAIGHVIGPDGTYVSGNTYIGVGQTEPFLDLSATLTADSTTGFFSGPSGELRFYIPSTTGWQGEGATLNEATTVPTNGTVLNNMGLFAFGEGSYTPDLTIGNYAFYSLPPEVEDDLEVLVDLGIPFGVVPGDGDETPLVVIQVEDALPPEVLDLLANPFFDFVLTQSVLEQLEDPFKLPLFDPQGLNIGGDSNLLPEFGNIFTLGSGEVEVEE